MPAQALRQGPVGEGHRQGALARGRAAHGLATGRDAAGRRAAADDRRLSDLPARQPLEPGRVEGAVDSSHDYVGSLGGMTLWPDFGGDGAYGIPYVSVPFSQPLVPISFDEADESDPGPYPTPLDAPVEGGGDRHVLTLRQGDCKLFELYAATARAPAGTPTAERSGTCARTRSGRTAGRPRTPRASRCCPAWRAVTRPTPA